LRQKICAYWRALQAALDAAIDHIESLAIEAGRRSTG
jgi:hypothetical protein